MRFPQSLRDTAQTSPGKLDRLPRTPAGYTGLALDGYGLRDQPPARPTKPASYPVPVRQVAVLIHASFRHPLARVPLRFTNPSPPSGWIEDFHSQAIEHAGHTACRADARHPDRRHRHRAPRRGPSHNTAAAAGCEKGLAGARKAELGGAGARRARREKAGIGSPIQVWEVERPGRDCQPSRERKPQKKKRPFAEPPGSLATPALLPYPLLAYHSFKSPCFRDAHSHSAYRLAAMPECGKRYRERAYACMRA